MFNYSIILLVCQDISILFYRPINVLFNDALKATWGSNTNEAKTYAKKFLA
jgi:hypothetical protein